MREYRARLRAARAARAAAPDDARADGPPADGAPSHHPPAAGGHHYRPEDLEAAFEAGRAFRLLEEVAAGFGDGAELARWVASEPPCLDLFLRHVAASPWPEVWQRWRQEYLA